MKSSELVIGIPTNSRMVEDLAPLRDIMRLEGKQGVLKSPDFPNARFRELRSQDIAKILASLYPSPMEFGIVGKDIMIEAFLPILDAWTYESGVSRSTMVQEVFGLDIGAEVELRALIRSEEKFNPQPINIVVTPYPNITAKAFEDGLRKFLGIFAGIQTRRIRLQNVAGKTESLIRNEDFGPTIAGIDLVRSGNTAKEFGLKTYGKALLVSRPGLYKKIGNSDPNLVMDFLCFFKERLKTAGIPILNEEGRNFEDALAQWTPI